MINEKINQKWRGNNNDGGEKIIIWTTIRRSSMKIFVLRVTLYFVLFIKKKKDIFYTLD